MVFKTTITKKTPTVIITALILISAVALAMHTNTVKAQPEPIMYASPDVKSFVTFIPPTSPLIWNFSIMVANLSQTYGYGITVIACSVKSVDPLRAVIINSFPGADFASKGFTTFMNGSWDPSTGDLGDLTASQTGNGAMITTSPIEIFKVEVNMTSFQPGSVLVDIYDQQAYDYQASQMLAGDCPYDQTVNVVNALTTTQITVDSTTYNVTTLSNSTTSAMTLDTNAKSLNFTTSGPAGTTGYINVTIPRSLLDCPEGLTYWHVIMDGADYTGSAIITQNSTHTFVYLAYSQSTHDIHITGTYVAPEYPSIAILMTFLTMMTVALALLRKVHKKQWQTL